MTLLPTLKMRLAKPSDLIDLAELKDLVGVSVGDGIVSIGAMTPHAAVNASAEVRGAIPALAKLAGLIGDPMVRNRGTIGGSISNNDPAADYPAAVVGLGATVHTNKRRIAGDDFFTGMFETALDEAELVTRVDFPVPRKSRLHEVPQSGLSVRHGRRVRQPRTAGNPGGGHRGRTLRVPGFRDGIRAGEQLRAGGCREHQDP